MTLVRNTSQRSTHCVKDDDDGKSFCACRLSLSFQSVGYNYCDEDDDGCVDNRKR